MDMYYRARKDSFIWKQGAILKKNDDGYVPIEDIWNATPVNGAEYISARIVEHPDNAEWFERVYPDSISGKLFKTKDQLLATYKGAFKK